MTPSQLKANYERSKGGRFFSRPNMRFAGDTMVNYGCCSATALLNDDTKIEVWCLYRKRPVKNGLYSPSFFSKLDFSIIQNIKEIL